MGPAKEIPNGAMSEPWQPDREKRLIGAKRPRRRSTRRRRPRRHDIRSDCLRLLGEENGAESQSLLPPGGERGLQSGDSVCGFDLRVSKLRWRESGHRGMALSRLLFRTRKRVWGRFANFVTHGKARRGGCESGQSTLYFPHLSSCSNFVQVSPRRPPECETVITLAIYLNNSEAVSLGICGNVC